MSRINALSIHSVQPEQDDITTEPLSFVPHPADNQELWAVTCSIYSNHLAFNESRPDELVLGCNPSDSLDRGVIYVAGTDDHLKLVTGEENTRYKSSMIESTIALRQQRSDYLRGEALEMLDQRNQKRLEYLHSLSLSQNEIIERLDLEEMINQFRLPNVQNEIELKEASQEIERLASELDTWSEQHPKDEDVSKLLTLLERHRNIVDLLGHW